MLVPVLMILAGCQEEFIGQTPTDDIPPGQISNPVVENTYGGAIITYDIPTDKDLCFIRAEYIRNGNFCTDHSSVYKNSIRVEGFGTTDPVEVSLYAVDFSMNRSEPVVVTIHPKEAFVHEIFRTLEPMNDFAGITLKWKNDIELPIGITLMSEENGVFIEKETYFSDIKDGEHAFRGFANEPTKFKAFIKDQWGNSSDTLSFEFTPMYEVSLDRNLYREVKLPFDCTSARYGAAWALWDNCHDGDTFDLGWVTELDNNPENDGRFPIMTTFDLGVEAQLSRVTMWMRGLVEYGTGAFKNVEFWGTDELATDMPNEYWASDDRGSWKNDWINLGEFETTKPSGPSGAATEDDKLWARENGFEFRFNVAPKVRYVRLLVNSTWSGAKCLELCEIAFMGNDKDSETNN